MPDSDKKQASSDIKKLGVLGLAAIVVSSMVGGGIYSLPQNMASGAGAAAVIIAWIITGIGIYFIANTFRILSNARPDMTAGIYMYSKAGFGNYVGFTTAWGYWMCQIFGNVGYAVITMDALNYFFPGYFTGGNNWESILGGSILIWAFNFIVLKGVKQASILNTIGTIGKLVPIFIFILVMLAVFNWDKFTFDFWGHMDGKGETNLGSLGAQVKSTMLVTLWAFIGIEGAVVLSGRAKNREDVGKATFLGFFGGLSIFVLISILPFGHMTQTELSNIANPSTAGVLENVVGPWGSWLMNAGVLVAVLASWLAWTMITAELPYAAARDGTFPKIFARENSNGAASVSLWITSILMQLAMLLVYFSNNAWNTMLSITGVMVLPPYLACTAYLWKISNNKTLLSENPELKINAKFALMSGILGSLYALWLIYAAGLDYLLVSVIILALGIPFYAWARAERKEKAFTRYEAMAASAIVAIAIIAAVMLSTGGINLDSSSTSASQTPAAQNVQTSSPTQKSQAHSPIIKRHGHAVPTKEKVKSS